MTSESKDKEFWRKLGRNNKNRGRTFERRVADILGWTRVPYSGGHSEWGGGDVIDGFYSKHGFWSAECKTQPQGPRKNIGIQGGWITQSEKNCAGRHPIIITKLHSESTSYVFMQAPAFVALDNKCNKMIPVDIKCETVMRGKGHGFVLQRAWLEQRDWTAARVSVLDKEGDRGGNMIWYVMKLEDFKRFVHMSGYMTWDPQEKDND